MIQDREHAALIAALLTVAAEQRAASAGVAIDPTIPAAMQKINSEIWEEFRIFYWGSEQALADPKDWPDPAPAPAPSTGATGVPGVVSSVANTIAGAAGAPAVGAAIGAVANAVGQAVQGVQQATQGK